MMKKILPHAAFLLIAGTSLANATETATTTISDLTFSNISASAGTATVNSSSTDVSATFQLGSETSTLLDISNKIVPNRNLQNAPGTSAGQTIWTLNFTLSSEQSVSVNQVVLKLFSCTNGKQGQNYLRNGTFDCSLGDTSGTLDKTNLTYTTDTSNTASNTAKTASLQTPENMVALPANTQSTTTFDNTISLVFNFDAPVTIGKDDSAITLAVKGIRPTVGQGGSFAGLAGITLNSVSAIPEPSMFGVLAGLGALALVGARRRRRK